MQKKPNKRGEINNSLKVLLLISLFLVLAIGMVGAQDDQKLNISRDDWIIEPNKEFTVTVTDQNGTEVENAYVSIDNGMNKVPTNSNGVAYLTSPSKEGKYNIVAEKNGYESFRGEIKVDGGPAFWETPLFPILLGGLCLVSAVLFVYLREKKSIYNRATQISQQNIIRKYENTNNQPIQKPSPPKNEVFQNKNKQDIYKNPYHPETIRSTPIQDSKVEEIRIRRPRKDKEVVAVEEEKDEAEKVISDAKMKKRDYEWFQGNDDARYEIDKITGEVDEEQIDKWFEGVDSLKEKIDEKVKKDKKKREEKEE